MQISIVELLRELVIILSIIKTTMITMVLVEIARILYHRYLETRKVVECPSMKVGFQVADLGQMQMD